MLFLLPKLEEFFTLVGEAYISDGYMEGGHMIRWRRVRSDMYGLSLVDHSFDRYSVRVGRLSL